MCLLVKHGETSNFAFRLFPRIEIIFYWGVLMPALVTLLPGQGETVGKGLVFLAKNDKYSLVN